MARRAASLSVVVMLTVLAASCGSTSERSAIGASPASSAAGDTATTPGDAGGTSRPGTGGSGSAPRAGVANGGPSTSAKGATSSVAAPAAHPTSGLLEVGVLYTVNDGAQSAGIDNGDTITPDDVMHAFVASYNASGGIGGRKIVPVYANLHSASHDYEAQAQAVCATFTEDNHVAVVLSTLGYYSPTLQDCLGKAHVPLVSGDWTAPDSYDAKRLPLYVTPNALLGDVRMDAVVRHLTRSKFLGPHDRFGVVIEGCAVDRRVYENGLRPALTDAGLHVASTFEAKCFESIQDFAEQTSQMSSAALRFRQADVDRVIVVSEGAEANLLFAFSTVAEQQGWHPGYALSSVAAPVALALNAPSGQLVNMHGVGWMPTTDSAARDQGTTTGRHCVERMKGRGIEPSSNTDLSFVYSSCDTFALYDTVLRSTNGDARPDVIRTAIAKVGASYVSALALDGQMVVSGGRIRPARGRLFGYTPAKGFAYSGPSFAL